MNRLVHHENHCGKIRTNRLVCELRTMPRVCQRLPTMWPSGPERLQDRLGDRETIIRNFLSGQYSNALRVVAFNTAEGWSRDASEDIASEVLDRAFD
jgi:hypothetical protein